ncbi:ATP-binding protein, partial [bacterium]|nr:ATP-binding protein [candidate division CSSED10-310 bacterium]
MSNTKWKDLDEMIGRENEIKDIQKAFEKTGVNIIYLIGDGGMGKTRMLRYLIDNPKKFCEKRLFPEKYVDLYHIENHYEQGLIESLIECFPHHKTEFKPVKDILTELENLPLTGASTQEYEGKVKTLKETFIQTLQTLGEKQKVVLLFDTGETWAVENYQTPAKDWLFGNDFIPALKNATTVFAGRPEIKNSFGLDSDKDVIIKLGNFDPEDSKKFIDAIIEPYDMEGFDESDIALLSDACEGNPIRISLYVQMYAHATSDQKKKLKELVAKQQSLEEFDAKIIGQLLTDDADTTEPLRWLGAARKGLTAKLLTEINLDDAGTAKTILEDLSGKVFVKVRKEKGKEPVYFLHDLVYDMMEDYAYTKEDRSKPDLWYRYGTLAEVIKHDLPHLENEKLLNSIEETHEDIKDLVIELKELSTHRGKRRGDILYYMFRDQRDEKPFLALRHFVRYLHDSHGNNMQVSLHHISQEAEKYLASPTENQSFTYSQWIKEIFPILQIHSQTPLKLLPQVLLNEFNRVLGEIQRKIFSTQQRQVLLAFFNVWQANLSIYLDIPNDDKIHLLEKSEELIAQQESTDMDEETRWLSNYVLAFTYRLLGYLYRTQGNFDLAKYYNDEGLTKALLCGIHYEQITIRTNRAFVYSQLGQYDKAITDIESALPLIIHHRFTSTLGYALNTLSSIYIDYEGEEENYKTAISLSQKACTIFDVVGNSRGKGMAVSTNTQAKRRLALKDKNNRETLLREGVKAIKS